MKDRERLWPNSRHCVFYLFRASLWHVLVLFAVDSRHWQFHFVPAYLLIWMTCFWLKGFCANGFFFISGWLFLAWVYFAMECWRFIPFFCGLFFLFVWFLFAEVASLLSLSFCQSLLFHTLMFLFPLLSIMLLPLFLQCILGTRKWSQMPRMR